MKESTKKPSLKQRLLRTFSRSTLAMIQTYGMGISPAEAYAFLDQKGLFTPSGPIPDANLWRTE